MLCKYVKSKRMWSLIVAIGLITLAFGIVCYKIYPNESHNLDMLMGMLTGVGSAVSVVGIIRLIRLRLSTDDKLRQQKIELTDERNVLILKSANNVSSIIGTVLLILMAFVFVALDYIVPAFIAIGAMYVQLLGYLIAYRYYNNKM